MAEVWTVLKILEWTGEYLEKHGVAGGRREAEILLADLLGLNRVGLYLNFDRPLDAGELDRFRERVRRRARREPVQYILGRTEFWSLPLVVGPAVLIPRPDTEVLVEEALRRAPDARAVLDVGTGSGAIAVALSSELPEAVVEGIDLSPEALEVARENGRRNGLDERLRFSAGEMKRLPAGPYDLIVANPPYIPRADLAGLMPEVREHEPRIALDGGEDGLDCYRLLAAGAMDRLGAGGWLLLEVGIDQAAEVERLLRQGGFQETFRRADYSGIPRVVGGRAPGENRGGPRREEV